MSGEIITHIDELGRIALPKTLRNELNWGTDEKISISRQNEHLILTKYRNSCFLCGGMKQITLIHERFICTDCMDLICRCRHKTNRL